MIGALLAMLRRIPVESSDGLLVGRELGGATVGLIGMAPAARSMVQILSGFGSRVVGYDPSVHASDGVWARWRVEPLGLRELLEESDAVCAQLSYFTRYRGLIGERFLPFCKPNQVLVSVAHSALFDEAALADVLVQRPHVRGLARQPRPGRARPGPAAARHRVAADHAARGEHDARVAQPQRMGGRQAHRRAAEGDTVCRRANSGRRDQASRLILQPAQRRREVGEALPSPDRPLRRARARRSCRSQAWPSPSRSRPAAA